MSLIIIAGILLFIAIAWVSYIFDKKRREALLAATGALGLTYTTGSNYNLVSHLSFLNRLREGENRYADSVVTGIFSGHEILYFDFHYETYSTDNKGNRTTHHHWYHIASLQLPRVFSELTIGRENIFTRIGRAFGYPSIDFESHEFSKTFLVQANDKKFAYDICHARAMEYLLKRPYLNIEIDRDRYALIFNNRMSPADIAQELNYLIELRALMPDYLFASEPSS